MSGTASYLYCIVHAVRSPGLRRVPAGLPGASAPATSSLGGSLWLVVADVPLDVYGSVPLETALRDLDWVARIAVAHEAVVDHFVRQPGSTVVPMKLFTMFTSADRARAEMLSRLSGIEAIVRRIAGCEEWGVRLVQPPVRIAASRRPDVSRPSSGAAFLAGKKEARDRAREAASALANAAESTFSTLAALAKDTRRREDAPAGLAPPLLDAAFLVARTDRARFKTAVRRVGAATRKAGADLTLTGPWPAYNFVQDQPTT